MEERRQRHKGSEDGQLKGKGGKKKHLVIEMCQESLKIIKIVGYLWG